MTGQIQNLPPTDVHAYLNSKPDGLNKREVTARMEEVGPNTLEAPKGLWWLHSLIRQLTNFFTVLLDISALICFVADYIQPGEQMNILGWALLAVSMLNALFSFAQEYRAERAMEELRKFLPQKVIVRRTGEDGEVAADQLVPGDVILIREGDKVPADARMVDGSDLIVDNSPLTGESIPVPITAAASELALTESGNILFAGCTVLRGSAEAVVFATGFRTQFGRIAKLSHEIPRTASPLERQTSHMVRVLTIIAVSMGLVFFTYGVITERSLWVNLVFMMGIIVANVPEGLLPTFTLSLAMGSLRMAKRNVLVKGLSAVEAMGAIHVICTDKTGTLTLNRLSVCRLADPVTGRDMDTDKHCRDFLATALNAADIGATDEGLSGDPLDIAIAERFRENGGDPLTVNARISRRFSFDAERRRAAGITTEANRTTFVVKGAWESLRPLITSVRASGEDGAPLAANSDTLNTADSVVHQMASGGERVIAVASRSISREEESAELIDLERDLVLEGFIGLEDPIRPEIPKAARQCHDAGIGMIMITGDHPETAEAIARKAGILVDGATTGQTTVTGGELAKMRERDLINLLEKGATVFARTNPEQKMKIVAALHQMDRVVAMTGDGVNDAPALKAADVGIAMGLGGTDVAREAAKVILLDDNFASIVAGIEEGRTIFGNIRKFTNYVLVSNGPEILPYIIYMLFPVPLALTVIQILAIDLGTDIIPSMALGQEKPTPGTMQESPRDQGQSLLSFRLIAHSYFFLGLIEAIFSLSLFFWVLHAGGWVWGQELASSDPLYRSATGITLSSILLMQIGNLFGRRSRTQSGLDLDAFKNPLLVTGIVFEIIFSWAILYFPPVSNVIGSGPVDPYIYAIAWIGMPLIFGLDFLRKKLAPVFQHLWSGRTAP